jgi:hypothetical protein
VRRLAAAFGGENEMAPQRLEDAKKSPKGL